MPTLPVYLTSQEFLALSQAAANATPSKTPEEVGQEVLRAYIGGLKRAKGSKQ